MNPNAVVMNFVREYRSGTCSDGTLIFILWSGQATS